MWRVKPVANVSISYNFQQNTSTTTDLKVTVYLSLMWIQTSYCIHTQEVKVVAKCGTVTLPSILAYRRPWPGYILYPLKLHNSTLKTTKYNTSLEKHRTLFLFAKVTLSEYKSRGWDGFWLCSLDSLHDGSERAQNRKGRWRKRKLNQRFLKIHGKCLFW